MKIASSINTNATDAVNRFNVQQSYTDLHQLQNIRQHGGDQEAALKQVAKQFESMFMQMMLKSMRTANKVFAKDNPLNSSEMEFHRDMYDKQLTLSLSQGQGMGLAEVLFRQLKGTYLSDNDSSQQTTEYTVDDLPRVYLNPYIQGNVQEQTLASAFENSKNAVSKSLLDVASDKGEHQQGTPKQWIEDIKKVSRLDNPQDFIDLLKPYAKKAAELIGGDYRALIAQSALETGWGKYINRDSQGQSSLNLFNIKADNRWQGHSVSVPTIEYIDGLAIRETAKFRRYDSIAASFNDYLKFISGPRYEKALAVAKDAEQFVKELHSAGYATDPRYTEKVLSILKQFF